MHRILLAAALAFGLSSAAAAAPMAFPPGFQVRDIPTNGAVIHVRFGGTGPAVVLLHGFGDTGDMWAPLAAALAKDHTVIVPDLRGMGDSSHPDSGYDKKTESGDVVAVLDALKVGKTAVVTHDIGNMVGYAFVAQNPDRVMRFALLDAPIPGIGPWDEITRDHRLWHFSFWGPDEERIVAGRERLYLDRFYNEFSADPKGVDEATRAHYAAIYARPHAMHDAFEQFKAFDQDAADNKVLAARGKLTMPVLAIGGDHSFGTTMATVMGFVASDVKGVVIANSGHWLMEEQPAATIAAIQTFLSTAP
ncbi:MAG: alpha/beta hydrolase [Proteobacteria bacterium]|nr:alpha/beta hydrolase [Pseudomonadota bacterium]